MKHLMWTILCYFCYIVASNAQYTPAVLQIQPGPQPQTVCITAPVSGLINTCTPIGTLNSATGIFTPVGSGQTLNLTGYIFGNGVNPATASLTIPVSSVKGLNGNLLLQDTNTWTNTNIWSVTDTFSTPPIFTGLSGPLFGNGSSAITAGTVSGNTTKLATVSGALISGNCPKADSNGNLVDGGSPCGTATGTVGSSTANNLAYYAVTGSNVTGLSSANNGTLITSGAGVPSISSTLPAAVQGNITSVGTLASGNIPASLLTGTTLPASIVTSSLTTVGTVTVGSFPAANLTGTTLASNVVSSSLTSLGSLTTLVDSGTLSVAGAANFSSTIFDQATPTLSVGLNPLAEFSATKTSNIAGISLQGVYAVVTDNGGWVGTGQNNFIEGVRGGAVLGNATTLGSGNGGTFAANDGTATSHHNMMGVEGETINNTETAPTPDVLNCSVSCTLSAAVLGDSDGSKAADAIFLINPYPATSKAQTGFLSAGNGLTYAAFADVSTSSPSYGIALLGTYPTATIYALTANPHIDLAKTASGQASYIETRNGSNLRWQFILGNSTAEGGSNAGSDMEIDAYADGGGFLYSVFSVVRSTGVTFMRSLNLSAAPTSCAGQPAGTLWKNGSVINIC